MSKNKEEALQNLTDEEIEALLPSEYLNDKKEVLFEELSKDMIATLKLGVLNLNGYKGTKPLCFSVPEKAWVSNDGYYMLSSFNRSTNLFEDRVKIQDVSIEGNARLENTDTVKIKKYIIDVKGVDSIIADNSMFTLKIAEKFESLTLKNKSYATLDKVAPNKVVLCQDAKVTFKLDNNVLPLCNVEVQQVSEVKVHVDLNAQQVVTFPISQKNFDLDKLSDYIDCDFLSADVITISGESEDVL